MTFRSPACSVSIALSRRWRLAFLAIEAWFCPGLMNVSLPEPVRLKRLAAARLVFIFATSINPLIVPARGAGAVYAESLADRSAAPVGW